MKPHSGITKARRDLLLLGLGCAALCPTGCGSSTRAARPVEEPATAPLFREAEREFRTMTSTLYQHRTQVDKMAGSYRFDCVGFVSHGLREAAPQAWESIFKTLSLKPGRIPTPGRYAAFFKSLPGQPRPGWQHVDKASELRPGDVVAWEFITETSNGHAVIIASLPIPGPEHTWTAEVYDSTSSPHGSDSRPGDQRAMVLDTSGRRSGLGRGIMAFTADPDSGALTGYRWSPKSKARAVPIAAGRPVS